MVARIAVALVVAATLLGGFVEEAEAQPGGGGPFGLGIILYEPTGLTGKLWLTSDQALDFHLGVQGLGNSHHDNLGIYVDYLFHFDVGAHTSVFNMPIYLGPGGAIVFDDDDEYCTKFGCYDRDGDGDVALAARMPFGLSFLFTGFAGEAFLELSLQMVIIPDVWFDLDAALGFRFYF